MNMAYALNYLTLRFVASKLNGVAEVTDSLNKLVELLRGLK